MGVFSVKARVRNPFKPSPVIELELIVDTGATYTVLPTNLLEKLGIEPIKRIRLRLADNRVVERDLGQIEIELIGYGSMITPVVFGDEGIYLLGSITLEQFSLAPDPVEKKLKPVEALLMSNY